jgi:hypothetical protein
MRSFTTRLRTIIDRLAPHWFWLVSASVMLCYWVVLAFQPGNVQGIVIGEPSGMTIYAPRTITYTSTLLTDQLRDAAASSPDLVVVTVDEALLDDARIELAAILAEIGAIRGNGRAYAARSQEIDAIDAGLDVALIPTETALQIMFLKDREWEALSLVIMAVYDDAVREASQRIDAATAEWETIQLFLTLTQSNAYFYEKRKDQNQFWMLQTIEEQLKMQFYNNPNIATLLEEHKKAVQNDLISPFAAAQVLLDAYLKK